MHGQGLGLNQGYRRQQGHEQWYWHEKNLLQGQGHMQNERHGKKYGPDLIQSTPAI